MSRLLRLRAVLALMASMVAGCSSDATCTLVGCVSEMALLLDGELATLEEGDYRVEYTAFGTSGFCVLAVEDGVELTYGMGSEDLGCRYTRSTSTVAIVLPESVTGEEAMGSAQAATLSITRNATEQFAGTVELEVEAFYPNGNDCGEGCITATATVDGA